MNGCAWWASWEEGDDVHKKPLPSAQSAVQVATVRGYSERQDRTARSQAYLSNFSQPDSVVSKPILSWRAERRGSSRHDDLGIWSQNCSIGAQGRSTHNGDRLA